MTGCGILERHSRKQRVYKTYKLFLSFQTRLSCQQSIFVLTNFPFPKKNYINCGYNFFELQFIFNSTLNSNCNEIKLNSEPGFLTTVANSASLCWSTSFFAIEQHNDGTKPARTSINDSIFRVDLIIIIIMSWLITGTMAHIKIIHLKLNAEFRHLSIKMYSTKNCTVKHMYVICSRLHLTVLLNY